MTGRPPSCTCGECAKCKHAAYMREWYRRKTPAERKAWVERRDIAKVRAADRKRRGTEARRASLRANSRRMAERYPERHKAKQAVGNAIRSGRLLRLPCKECGNVRAQAHHPNGYAPDHWFDIEWLCVRHHKAAHGTLRPEPF